MKFTGVMALDDHTLIVGVSDGLRMDEYQAVGLQFRARLPDWKVLILPGDLDFLDLRGRPDLAAKANELIDALTAVIEDRT